MQYIIVNQSSGHVLALPKGRGLITCRAFWTRERRLVRRFDNLRFAATVAKMAGGAVLSTREAELSGLIGKAVR